LTPTVAITHSLPNELKAGVQLSAAQAAFLAQPLNFVCDLNFSGPIYIYDAAIGTHDGLIELPLNCADTSAGHDGRHLGRP
jgi:hypothetical protein